MNNRWSNYTKIIQELSEEPSKLDKIIDAAITSVGIIAGVVAVYSFIVVFLSL